MAGKTTAHGGASDADGGGLAGLRLDPASGASMLGTARGVYPWQQRANRHTNTATVIFESFATVMRVELTLEDMRVSQIQGWQAHHERICKALELDLSIYEDLTTQENYSTMGKGP